MSTYSIMASNEEGIRMVESREHHACNPVE